MILLSADTSSSRFSIALLRGGSTIAFFESESINRHSSDLLPQIDRLLKEALCDMSDVDGFCIGLGPGSFTGLRVGVTTIRGLAMALKKPIVGVPSIDALAYNVNSAKGQVCVIIDARQGKVYGRIYSNSEKGLRADGDILLLPIRDILAKIKKNTLFLGDAIGLYRKIIEEDMRLSIEFAPEALWYPKAQVIGRLGFNRLKASKVANVMTLAPLYIYPRECQIKMSRSSQYEKFKK